jgi:putative Mg2+ transporter-C (MgtC) family protein
MERDFMLENIKQLSDLNLLSISFRILLAMITSGLIGMERERKQRPAGFRTYVVVCLGATLTCITNLYMSELYPGVDPSRIPAQVVSGIGFLGAGTIIVTKNSRIKGLTTAAGLWCCATIGIAIGSGFYTGAIICSIAVIIIMRFLTFVDKSYFKYNKYVYIYVECDHKIFMRSLIDYANKKNYSLYDIDHIQQNGDSFCSMVFSLKVTDPLNKSTVVEEIRQLDGCLIIEELGH